MKGFLRKALLGAAASVLLCSWAQAQEVKIGFIDLQKALNESQAGKEAKAELESLMQELQRQIDQKVAERDKLRAELQKQALVLSPEARRAKADELQQLDKEVERLISDANEQMQKAQRDKELAILKEIKAVVDELGQKEGFTVILPAEVILYSAKGVDLTDRVIKLYDKKRKAQKKK
mgnify:CR=1 FL=1|jgi:outer membrane protein